MSDLCLTPHDPTRRALPSIRLCGTCRNGLERDLHALPKLYEDLAQALATTSASGQRVTGTSSEPLPINPAVADHRDQIRHDLTWWTLYIADQRGLTLPAKTVAKMADWLGLHVDWIAAHADAAEQCPPVFRALTGRARALLDPNRRLATGERCRNTPDDAERCTGTITMVQRPDETWEARCGVCGSQEAAPYLHDRLAGRLVTIDRAKAYALRAHGRTVTDATIRSWARRGHIRTTETDGAVWYDLGSIETYLTTRRERAAG